MRLPHRMRNLMITFTLANLATIAASSALAIVLLWRKRESGWCTFPMLGNLEVCWPWPFTINQISSNERFGNQTAVSILICNFTINGAAMYRLMSHIWTPTSTLSAADSSNSSLPGSPALRTTKGSPPRSSGLPSKLTSIDSMFSTWTHGPHSDEENLGGTQS